MTSLPIIEGAPLAPRTTLSVGGPARYLIEASTPPAILEALTFAREKSLPLFVLGGGSNLLIADRGLEAVVLCVHLRGIHVYTSAGEASAHVYTPDAEPFVNVYTPAAEAPANVYTPAAEAPANVYTSPATIDVKVAAGEPWDAFVARAVAEGWAGIECLSGIPGSVGATPIQNVGAYGQEVADTILSVDAIDRTTGAPVTLPAADCAFSYRDSAFKRALADRYILTAVTFRLHPGGPPALRYAELQRALAATPSPSLAQVRATVLSLRRSKSMVYDPTDENHRSAGSFFTNPLVPPEVLTRAREAARSVLRPGETMPEYPAEEALTKLSAAWLIERSGYIKGTHEGQAGLSTRHTLALVNRGTATATDLIRFATKVKQAVHSTFGVTLMPEPILLGFAPSEIATLQTANLGA